MDSRSSMPVFMASADPSDLRMSCLTISASFFFLTDSLSAVSIDLESVSSFGFTSASSCRRSFRAGSSFLVRTTPKTCAIWTQRSVWRSSFARFMMPALPSCWPSSPTRAPAPITSLMAIMVSLSSQTSSSVGSRTLYWRTPLVDLMYSGLSARLQQPQQQKNFRQSAHLERQPRASFIALSSYSSSLSCLSSFALVSSSASSSSPPMGVTPLRPSMVQALCSLALCWCNSGAYLFLRSISLVNASSSSDFFSELWAQTQKRIFCTFRGMGTWNSSFTSSM
mmetsp:Transcript_3675/g.9914  ORF Transcript_3675/g.9914 Transcript_3675/m.9914 type:complete len:281 (-) Transcript_3675:1139-1981(-)